MESTPLFIICALGFILLLIVMWGLTKPSDGIDKPAAMVPVSLLARFGLAIAIARLFYLMFFGEASARENFAAIVRESNWEWYLYFGFIGLFLVDVVARQYVDRSRSTLLGSLAFVGVCVLLGVGALRLGAAWSATEERFAPVIEAAASWNTSAKAVAPNRQGALLLLKKDRDGKIRLAVRGMVPGYSVPYAPSAVGAVAILDLNYLEIRNYHYSGSGVVDGNTQAATDYQAVPKCRLYNWPQGAFVAVNKFSGPIPEDRSGKADSGTVYGDIPGEEIAKWIVGAIGRPL